ncbi:MAG: LapA family protein [Pseudanabaena sp. CAN_BIN31]|nr:LapA family protein [Pseudanabaena sp. CAN_BIN31]
MTQSRFSKTPKPTNKRSSSAIAQFIILGFSITILAAIVVQNLQPAVQIFFLGQKTIAIPLSVAMLAAFVGGGILAFLINAIASWRHNQLVRRALTAAGSDKDPQEQVKAEKFQAKETFVDDDISDEEYEDDEDEEVYDDPDTVPYGDRPNMKAQGSNQANRPPLDAKFIK